MALLLAVVRSHSQSALMQQTARGIVSMIASPVAFTGLDLRAVCSCSQPGAIASTPVAAQQQQQLQQATCCTALPAQWSSQRTFFSQFTKPDSKVYKERRLIGYSPEQLYEVVSGVQHYHQFVPWCVRSNVLKQTPDGSYLEAELQIGFQMISERYISKVKLQEPHLVSSTVADSALFHHLESTWQMKPGPNPGSTWLSFSVDFAFLNPLYANIAHLFFSEVVTRMMGAFEGRCKQLYGPPSFSPAGQRHLVQQRHKQLHKQHHLKVQQGAGHAMLQHAPAGAATAAAAASSTAVQQQPGPGRQQQQQPWQQQEE